VFDLATDLALALDPVGLAEQAGIYPDRWQRNGSVAQRHGSY